MAETLFNLAFKTACKKKNDETELNEVLHSLQLHFVRDGAYPARKLDITVLPGQRKELTVWVHYNKKHTSDQDK